MEETGWVVAGIVVIAFIFLLFGTFYTVNPQERCMIQTMGALDDKPRTEGLNVKVPLFQKVICMNIQTQKYQVEASASSNDMQDVKTEVAVNYFVAHDSVSTLYRNIGTNYENVIIQPAIQEVVKASTAQFTAEELITKRPEAKKMIDEAVHARLAVYGLTVQDVSITNFAFSEAFNAAIEAKVVAQQQALQAQNQLEKVKFEQQQKVITAEAEKTARITQAEGLKQATILEAEAQAQKILLIQQQLSQSKDYIELQRVQQWDGKLPTMMLGDSTPLVNVGTIVS